ncbi:site-specific DNA-methyltransferase (plasmid) [Arsenophonus nasoniae]|uniref:site-specific DNA-methyltransferase (adenine-specific) n=1 Tax=Arsenophonus nasoniae TaxID=638 RepID=A0A4P7L9U7_9GAMM|nr:site-specific DNA-methyltransferase [Arsenophonus nasoniae]QBY46598.1 Modification methylase MboII [Arsenophonus nasoniae]WGM13233.1 site-specific DNA-methyltransferase [Arsenophonus nasoniae]WGM17848.1 site-specific DNA-methyltransferase [Arsenophonus nasoniae]
MQTKLFRELNRVLKAFPQFWNGEELHRTMVIEAINRKQPEVIKALVSNEKIKSVYGTDIDGIFIFDFGKLCSLLKYKEYWANSFTKYRNKVGLTSEGKYLDYSSDVVLDFPFKDCVLEGGMTKEDQGKDEVYYNEIIARDEIDCLLSPKVLTNAKRYTKDNIEENIIDFHNNDNLIIKGNNLIVLHSLKVKYQSSIKCVFIDPPYYFHDTKPADTFIYNSNFKLSSWLVFMKNRLEIAKDLMCSDGVIYITISDDGAHYLKVLMDQVFSPENFIADVIWQSRKSISSDGLISISSNHVLTYAKNKKSINKNSFRMALDVEGFNLEDEFGKYKVEPFDAPNERKNLSYKITNPTNGSVHIPPKGRHWRTTENEFLSLLKNNRIQFGTSGIAKPQLKVYLEDAIQAGKGKSASTIWDTISPDIILWNSTDTTTNATKHQQKIFDGIVFENPKPEGLVQRALELASSKGDIVLDFHIGSGTTAATAHKMSRRYIGIEQMDYINDITVPRLQKVIDGEQGGISKDVHWQGGGSFVYAELMELNAYFVHQIQKAQFYTELDG